MSNLIQDIMNRYQDYDRNANGDPAIISLSFLDFERSSAEIPNTARMVLVLVESRLLSPLAGDEDLQPRLLRFKGDLGAEGFSSRFICVDLYQGDLQQDGRTLLALRSFLREVRITFPNFEGIVLVGSFPEATLVRRCIWVTGFKNINIGGTVTKGEPYLTIWPQNVAHRAEIVLTDLDGNWHALYHEEPEQLESIAARPDAATAATAWPVDGGVFSSTSFNRTMETFRDFFFIQDDDYAVLSAEPQQLRLLIRRQLRHPELSPADRSLANPLARPDILVSRINPRNVAVNPKPSIVGDNGARPLDAQGYPQSFTSNQAYDTWLGFFQQDPVLERRVLGDYFDRNHRFRIGAFANLPFRAGAIGSPDFGADPAYLAPASSKFEVPLVQDNATLLDYVRWFKKPAVLRSIESHSSAFSSQFGEHYSADDLESEVGGRPFRWRRVGNTYTPSLHDQGPHADFYVHRTAWQNNVLAGAGANLIIHGGCEVNVPAGAQITPYYKEGYAGWQNAEGLLFYMNGLALIARAKVFNDLPTGFPGALAHGPRTHFGDGWRASFDNDAADPNLGTFDLAIASKKAYFWSMLGDWTTRLRYRGGLGILGFDPQFRAVHVHADQAWIDGWNFDTTANAIRGVGDLDGDGISEFLITSAWGIGILKHDGSHWRQVLVAHNGTRFDGFLLNTADDHFGPVADFDGDGRDEILVTSAWGIGILALTGNTLHTLLLAANSTRFDGFLLNTADDHFGPVADFDGDGRDEILVTSAWGIGVLALTGNALQTRLLAANGTRFDGFLLNTADDHFGPVADLDGDGQDEILVTSAWGIGVLALAGNTLHPLAMAAHGTSLGDWVWERDDRAVGVWTSSGSGGRRELLIQKGSP